MHRFGSCSGGSVFEMRGAAVLKARDAATNLVRGISKSFLFTERRFRVGTNSVNNSVRSSGSTYCRILYAIREVCRRRTDVQQIGVVQT